MKRAIKRSKRRTTLAAPKQVRAAITRSQTTSDPETLEDFARIGARLRLAEIEKAVERVHAFFPELRHAPQTQPAAHDAPRLQPKHPSHDWTPPSDAISKSIGDARQQCRWCMVIEGEAGAAYECPMRPVPTA